MSVKRSKSPKKFQEVLERKPKVISRFSADRSEIEQKKKTVTEKTE